MKGRGKKKGFAAGLAVGVEVAAAGSTSELVLMLDAAYPGDPGSGMDLPAEVWDALVELAHAEKEAAGEPLPRRVAVVDSGGPGGDATVEATLRREGDRLVVEGLRTTPAKKGRLLKVEPDPQFDGPAEAAP